MSLLTLPPELKLRILEYYTDIPQAQLCHRGRGPSQPGSYWRFWFEDNSSREIRLSLLRVCRKLRADLIQYLASRSTLRINTSCFGIWVSSAATSLLLEQYARHVRHVACDQALSIDVVKFCPLLEKLSLRCSIVGPLVELTGVRIRRRSDLEQDSVKPCITKEMTSMFQEETLNIRRAARGRTVELEIEREYGPFRAKPYSLKSDVSDGKALVASGRKLAQNGCKVDIKITEQLEKLLLDLPPQGYVVME